MKLRDVQTTFRYFYSGGKADLDSSYRSSSVGPDALTSVLMKQGGIASLAKLLGWDTRYGGLPSMNSATLQYWARAGRWLCELRLKSAKDEKNLSKGG